MVSLFGFRLLGAFSISLHHWELAAAFHHLNWNALLDRVELSPALPTVPLMIIVIRHCQLSCWFVLRAGVASLVLSQLHKVTRAPPSAGPGALWVHRSLPKDLRALDGRACFCDMLKRDTRSCLVLAPLQFDFDRDL